MNRAIGRPDGVEARHCQNQDSFRGHSATWRTPWIRRWRPALFSPRLARTSRCHDSQHGRIDL